MSIRKSVSGPPDKERLDKRATEHRVDKPKLFTVPATAVPKLFALMLKGLPLVLHAAEHLAGKGTPIQAVMLRNLSL